MTNPAPKPQDQPAGAGSQPGGAWFRELRRHSILPLAGVAMAAYYLLVFMPLNRRANSLNEPLKNAWQKLATSVEQPNALTLDFQRITNQLSETRHELVLLEEAKKTAASRLELPAELRAKLTGSFELFDYENERGKQMDDLNRKAREQKIVVDPLVYTGFPEHTADVTEPVLLWPALALSDDLLETAVRCQVAAIHSLEVALNQTNAASADVPGRWSEIAMQMEFTAATANALRLIQSLPLRADELKAVGLPAPSGSKAPLFIDRLVVRKENPEKVDEVRVWIRVVGFVLRE